MSWRRVSKEKKKVQEELEKAIKEKESEIAELKKQLDELERIVDHAFFIKNGTCVLQGDAEELRVSRGKSIVDMYKEIYA